MRPRRPPAATRRTTPPALADEQVVGLALCWDKAYFPYRTDHYEGWTNFPGWGVINYKTWFSTRPAV